MPTSLPITVDSVIDRLRAIQRESRPVTARACSTGCTSTSPSASPPRSTRTRSSTPSSWPSSTSGSPTSGSRRTTRSAGGRKPPSAWKPLFEERATPGLLPIQFALAGMNAHIENDLPLAVVATCRARHTSPASAAVRRDYEAVNDVLAAVESGIRRSFLSLDRPARGQEVGPVVHLVSAWNIDKARDLAWVNVETLWALRSLELLRDRYVGDARPHRRDGLTGAAHAGRPRVTEAGAVPARARSPRAGGSSGRARRGG